jgi:hypothetical protein
MKAALGPVHGAVEDEAGDQSEDDQRRLAARQHREEGEAEGGEAEPSEGVDRAAADPVRQPAEERDREELDRRPDQKRLEREASSLRGDVDEEGQREDGEDVIRDILPDPKPGAEHDCAGPLEENVHGRKLGRELGLFERLLEHRALLHPVADVPADGDEDRRQQEGDPPAPGEEVGLALKPCDQGQDPGREQASRGHSGLGPARPEAAAGAVAMLCRHQHRSAPFAAHREALDESKGDQAGRRPDPDLRIGRKKPDQDRRDPHQDEAQHEQALAADPVAIMAEDDPAQWPGKEADGISGEGEQGPDERIVGGEEELVEDEGRGRAVEEEIIPFDRRPDHARRDHPAQAPRPPFPAFVLLRHIASSPAKL